jgi:hypothetical protein
MTITTSIGIPNYDDSTPPFTTVSFNPETPDGDNGWYISYIWVTIEAVDDISGVNVTYYRINNGSWMVYEDYFMLYESNYYFIEFYSVDNAGNVEDVKNVSCKLDNMPPVTTATLDPSEPDGNNGWYISDVNVTLTATDDMSGVAQIIPREFVILTEEYPFVEFYSIDNAGNEEVHWWLELPIDQTDPIVDLTYEVTSGNPIEGWILTFTATAVDAYSGMERVEFYLNDELQDTVYGLGPCYLWDLHIDGQYAEKLKVVGLICNPKITDEYVKFFAFFAIASIVGVDTPQIYTDAYDNAGNMARDQIDHPCHVDYSSGIYIFKRVTLPNSYTGNIGKFYINAIFNIN